MTRLQMRKRMGRGAVTGMAAYALAGKTRKAAEGLSK